MFCPNWPRTAAFANAKSPLAEPICRSSYQAMQEEPLKTPAHSLTGQPLLRRGVWGDDLSASDCMHLDLLRSPLWHGRDHPFGRDAG